MEADAGARWEEAERLNAAGRYQHARPLYAGLGSERMYAPLAHLRLSVLDQRAGDLRGATAQGLAAMSAAYGDPELLELLCKTLLPLGETRAALACATALAGMPAPLQALAEVGKLMSDHMQPEAVLTLLQRAVAMGLAGAPAVRYLLGLNLMYLGRLDEARSELERSLAGNPGFAPAHWALSKVGPAPARGARIDRLRRLLERTESGARDAPLLWYSLFHELDGDDRPGEAWPALQTAMQLRRGQVQHDESAQDALFAAASCGTWRCRCAGARSSPGHSTRTQGCSRRSCRRTCRTSASATWNTPSGGRRGHPPMPTNGRKTTWRSATSLPRCQRPGSFAWSAIRWGRD